MRLDRLLIVSTVCALLAVPALAAEKRAPVDPQVRVTKIHDAIGITAAEESAWAPVADILLADAKAMSDLYKGMKGKIGAKAKVSTLERLKAQQAVATARQDHLAKLIPAVEKLYTVLTPEQQALADAAFAPQKRRKTAPPAQ